MSPSIKNLSLILGLGTLVVCQGCSKDMLAAQASLKEVVAQNNSQSQILDYSYEYLRVETPHGKGRLALGYRVIKEQLEVWFSADKTTFYLQGGRYAGSKNLALNWSEVKIISAPDLKNIEGAQTYYRERMVMPGYSGPVRETVTIERIKEAPSQAPFKFQDHSDWLVEYVASPQLPKNDNIVAYYARNPKTKKILWAMQCLNQSFCVSWEFLN